MLRRSRRQSHQRSWWIVHTQPTKSVGRTSVPNPTNAVGGSFILNLQKGWAYTRSRIPPTQLVDCSYAAYKGLGAHPVSNSTNEVGGFLNYITTAAWQL